MHGTRRRVALPAGIVGGAALWHECALTPVASAKALGGVGKVRAADLTPGHLWGARPRYQRPREDEAPKPRELPPPLLREPLAEAFSTLSCRPSTSLPLNCAIA